jgi:hypothetical protein
MAGGDDEVHSFDIISVYDQLLMRPGWEDEDLRVAQEEITPATGVAIQTQMFTDFVTTSLIRMYSAAKPSGERVRAEFAAKQGSLTYPLVRVVLVDSADTPIREATISAVVDLGATDFVRLSMRGDTVAGGLTELNLDCTDNSASLATFTGTAGRMRVTGIATPTIGADAVPLDFITGGIAAAPFVTLGLSGSLSGEFSILEADETELPDDDIHWEWNRGGNRLFIIDNIGAGDAQLRLPSQGSNGGILIGGDANLYRSASDELKTDDKFLVGAGLDVTGDIVVSALVDGVDVSGHNNAYNGSFLEPLTFVVTSNGSTITGTLDKDPTGDLTEVFSDGYSTMSSGATVTLVAGSATVPKKNHIYVLQSNKGVLVASDSDWPATEHIKVAEVIVQTAALVASDGILANRNWDDHAQETDGMGHHLDAWKRLRWEHAAYKSGSAVTWSGSGTSALDLAISAGQVYQMHLHIDAAFDTADPDNVYVVNHPTAYTITPDIETLVVDSGNVSLSNRYYNLVIWRSVSSGSEEEKVFINLPSGSYKKQSDAENDVSGFDNFNVPTDYRGYAYLIQRVTIKHSTAAGGTWTILQETDLRGTVPSIAVGGGTLAVTTEFADSAFKIFDDGDPTRELAFQLSGISAGTTRTLTVQDADGTIAYLADIHAEAHAAAEHNAAALPASANENLGAFFLDIDDIAVPANPGATIRRLFVDTATGALSVRTPAGATVNLEAGGYTDADAIAAVEGEDPLDLAGIVNLAKYLQFDVIAAPGTPAASKTRLYAKDLSAQSGMFYVDEAGNEFWLADSVFRNMPLSSTSGDWTTGASGTGIATPRHLRLDTNSGGATGVARISESLTFLGITRGSDRGVIDWDRRILVKVRFSPTDIGVNGISRISLGRQNTDGSGDPNDKAIGIKITTAALAGQVHSGAGLTTTATLATLTLNQVYDLLIISRADGTVEWFLDGTSIGTSTGGPTGTGTSSHTAFRLESTSSSAAAHGCQVFQYGYADLAA